MRLLQAYGSDPTLLGQAQLSDGDVETLYTLGLHYLVLHGVETGAIRVSTEMLELLHSADLTARVVHNQLCTTLEEVLVAADESSIPVVLLKGISNAADLYLQPHHRTMGDIDILVAPEDAEPLYRRLRDLGYQPADPAREMIWAHGHHHLHPLKHSRSQVPVEIHTALFSRASTDLREVFEPARVWASTEPAQFRGQPCLRLTSELDFVYTIAHWANDLYRTTNAIGICDIARMLAVRTGSIDWMQVRHWIIECPQLGDYATVVLRSVERAGIADTPAELQDCVAESADRIGRTNLQVLEFILKAYSLTGRPKAAGLLTREHANIVWNTLLEPGNRNARLPVAASRILNLRRQPGELLLSSLLRRIKKALSSSS